jgi:uncharacterized iron-regulated protein
MISAALLRRAVTVAVPGIVLATIVAGCSLLPTASAPDAPSRVSRLLPADVLVLGEQHDAPEHHAIERDTVQALARDGRLGALAIEMAEEGQSTAHLKPDATEAQVQTALSWSDKAWPWADYGPAIMAAVTAGVPVVGANLPRARMKDAMEDVSLDAQLGDAERAQQQQAVRDGHCGLLPESQIAPMTRIQIARDRSMAQVALKARVPGKTVLLIAGAGHATKTLGVAQHMPTDVRVKSIRLVAGEADQAPGYDALWRTSALPSKDYCATLRK